MPGVLLPRLEQSPSPNQSARRLYKGQKPYLIVVHRPAGGYQASIDWLCDPASEDSAHVITEHDRATQLVPWDRKAWACQTFNSVSYNVEVDDNAWNHTDEVAFRHAARIVAFLCYKTNIPPAWSRTPTHIPGVVRHFDLGSAGGGHSDPTTDDVEWARFLVRVRYEVKRQNFRTTWGRGRLVRL